ncbi:hypothetical protein M2283_006140 [Streptomyces pseudovenezuelae]|uniref:Uncharacterized protein n=1 Tax=Streptomyces pseudovenezuelae TaxID=67350 RepID=A0ABT6LRA0_9ACTN|nr:hypothetical protein [Streptomyces pseudovenezuelae]MDH6218806.1 hypothetical protein [Streptomyces pseudovenezuelae]
MLDGVGERDRVDLDEEHRLDLQADLATVDDGGDLGAAGPSQLVKPALGRRGGGVRARGEPGEAHPAVFGESLDGVVLVGIEAGTGRETRSGLGVADPVRLGAGEQGRLRRSGQGAGTQNGQGPQIQKIADDRLTTQGQVVALLAAAGVDERLAKPGVLGEIVAVAMR